MSVLATRLEPFGIAVPLGPSLEDPLYADVVQGASWRLGRRLCLLKDCDRVYRPNHPLSRYCSDSCRRAAARWYQREANRRYRASDHGKSCRRVQSCRYRRRKAEGRTAPNEVESPLIGGEGYGDLGLEQTFRCRRPGCYETFFKHARSPLQKFCNARCRHALQRVLVRERRWRSRWLAGVPPNERSSVTQ